MSAVFAAALLWPFLLVAVGLLIGRALRRGDRLQEVRPSGPPARPAPAPRRDAAGSQQVPVTLPGAGA